MVIASDEELKTKLVASIAPVDGVDLVLVDSAQKAIGLLQSDMPDVILADVALQDLDGFRLCKLLKHPVKAGTEQIPVVLVANEFRDVLAEHVARKAHAFAFLKMPCDAELVPRTVELALRRLLPDARDVQLLAYKGTVHVMSPDDALAHTITTALDLNEWRTVRFKTVKAMETAWKDGLPHVVFMEMEHDDSADFDTRLLKQDDNSPVVIALVKRVETENLTNLFRQGVDDYLTLPIDAVRVTEACGEARLKFNFRSMHREFDSQLVKLRAVSDYLELVITNSHEAIFTCDPNGVVKLWNKGAERVYGYSAEEIIGKNVDEYLDPPGFSRKSPNVVRLLQQRGSMIDPEVQRQRKSGEIFPVSAAYALLTDPQGKVLGFSVIERDVTTIKSLENERIKSARLRAITQTAVTANDHINTPLGIILGYAQFLELKLNTQDAQDKNALEVIQQQVHKIKGIMNKLKLISDPIVKNYSIEGVTMLDLTKSQLSDEATN